MKSAIKKSQEIGLSVSHAHLKYINPFPKNLGEILLKFNKILIPELNLGQLRFIIRSKYLVDAIGLNKIAGKPFSSQEILNKIESIIGQGVEVMQSYVDRQFSFDLIFIDADKT